MGHGRRNGETVMEAGVIVLTAFISPYRADREHARGLVGHGDFISSPMKHQQIRRLQ
jgi:adenylylsulfate kinase-like enzyme